jgi:YD repeat-containing protein
VTSISRNALALITYPSYAGTAWRSRLIDLGGTYAAKLETAVDRDGLGRRAYGITHTGKRGDTPQFTESFGYTRDLVGDPTPVTRTGNPLLPNETATYVYDTMHRVTDAAYASDSTTEDINLDVLGNRLTYTGPTGPQTTYTHNTVNEYTALDPQTTAPEYDANGNLTRNDRDFRFEYDYENRLTRVKVPNGVYLATYMYDRLGRRTAELRSDAIYNKTTLYYYVAGPTDSAHGRASKRGVETGTQLVFGTSLQPSAASNRRSAPPRPPGISRSTRLRV